MAPQILCPVPQDKPLPWPLRWFARQPKRPLIRRFDLAGQPERPLLSHLLGPNQARVAPKWTRKSLTASNLLASVQCYLSERWLTQPRLRHALPYLGLGNQATQSHPYRVMLAGLAQQPDRPLSKRMHTPILLRRPYVAGTFLVAGCALYFAAVFPHPWLQENGGAVIAAAPPAAVETLSIIETATPPKLAQAEAPSEPTPPWDNDPAPVAEPAPATSPEPAQQPPPPEPVAPAAETTTPAPATPAAQPAAAQPDPDLADRTRSAAILADARRLYTGGDGVAAVAKLEQALASGAIHSDYREGARGLKQDMQALLELYRQGDAAFKAGDREQAMDIWQHYLSTEQAVFLRPTDYSRSIKVRMTAG